MPRFKRTYPKPEIQGLLYGSYMPHVRNDFEGCCAYCMRHEVWLGEEGEIDHFRPQSKFPEFVMEFYNLYYACHKCNQIKSNKWPTLNEFESAEHFVDPCKDNFEQHYEILADGHLKCLTKAACYTKDKLRLNRPNLKKQRELIVTKGYALDRDPLDHN